MKSDELTNSILDGCVCKYWLTLFGCIDSERKKMYWFYKNVFIYKGVF